MNEETPVIEGMSCAEVCASSRFPPVERIEPSFSCFSSGKKPWALKKPLFIPLIFYNSCPAPPTVFSYSIGSIESIGGVRILSAASKKSMLTKYAFQGRNLRVAREGQKAKIIDGISGAGLRAFTVHDLLGLPATKSIESKRLSWVLMKLERLEKVLVRTNRFVYLPERTKSYIYTIDLGNPPGAFEEYIIRVLKSCNYPEVVAAYEAVKAGGVHDSINLKLEGGLGVNIRYLAAFCAAGLLKCRRGKLAYFYYNPKKVGDADVEKHIGEYEEAASQAREARISKGVSLEHEFQEIMKKHGHRFVFYMRGERAHPHQVIGPAERFPDAYSNFFLGVLVDGQIVHVPYQFGCGLVVQVELKATSVDSVSKGVTGDVVDRAYAESKISLRNSMNWFIGEPTHSGLKAAEEFESMVTPLSTFKELGEILDKTSAGAECKPVDFKEVRKKVLGK